MVRQHERAMLEFQQFDPIKLPLIKRFYKIHYPGAKPKSDERVIVASQGNEIMAVVRFRNIGKHHLLTGMVVNQQHRQLGIGKQLLGYCQQDHLNQATFCFAYTHLEHFYQQGGFMPIEPSHLPAELFCLFERYTNSGKNLIPMQYQSKSSQECSPFLAFS